MERPAKRQCVRKWQFEGQLAHAMITDYNEHMVARNDVVIKPARAWRVAEAEKLLSMPKLQLPKDTSEAEQGLFRECHDVDRQRRLKMERESIYGLINKSTSLVCDIKDNMKEGRSAMEELGQLIALESSILQLGHPCSSSSRKFMRDFLSLNAEAEISDKLLLLCSKKEWKSQTLVNDNEKRMWNNILPKARDVVIITSYALPPTTTSVNAADKKEEEEEEEEDRVVPNSQLMPSDEDTATDLDDEEDDVVIVRETGTIRERKEDDVSDSDVDDEKKMEKLLKVTEQHREDAIDAAMEQTAAKDLRKT